MENIRIKKPKVYYIDNFSPRGILKVYNALGKNFDSDVAVAIDCDAVCGLGFQSEIANKIVNRLDATVVVGSNENGSVLKIDGLDHSIDVLDMEAEIPLKISERGHLQGVCFVGDRIQKYKNVLVLSGFCDSRTSEFGGAIKNLAIGLASRYGKAWIYSAGFTKDPDVMWSHSANTNEFIESIAEAGKGVIDYISRGNIAYINILNVGDDNSGGCKIVASVDPVALDSACLDFFKQEMRGEKKDSAIQQAEKNMEYLLECSENLAVGERDYELVKI